MDAPATSLRTTVQRVTATKVPTFVFETAAELARYVGRLVAAVIHERNALGQHAVLAFPTGSSPLGIYRELVRLHKEEGLDFSGVVAFSLDEYYGVGPERLQSYSRLLSASLFDHVNIKRENIHMPSGLTPLGAVEAHCRDYELAIERAGGLDLCLLGIGRNGHIAFNEPFSIRNSRTRLCTLDPVTRVAAASDFFGEEHVPQQAITMGLGTILSARKLVLVALGELKATIIRETAEGAVTDRVPASYLQDHPDAALVVDAAAGKLLRGCETPWTLGNVEWTDALIKRALLWLSQKTGKALLKLDDDDLRNHDLHQLLRHHGPAQRVAHRVFKWMMDTIDYHPAGKDLQRKKIICFSPHPDDDVISMGGTLIRLVEDQHQVHIAYMTSGNIAVFDHDAQRIADLVTEYNRLFGIDQDKSRQVEAEVAAALSHKESGQPDIPAVMAIKGLIRWGEAKAGALSIGCREEHLHFLDLPFYRTGTVAKKPVGPEDVRIIRELIERERPDQIYVAGDLSDPHGTHRVCAEAIFQAIDEIVAAHRWRPEVLLYRGAWQEYELHEIEIAVPLSPQDLLLKRKAIFMHESQKDEALFPGTDPREFWQRAEDRNKGTASKYNSIGLPEYYALEAFVRWKGGPI